jgi:protein gp37
MAQNSKIEWTNHTANLWHGCTKVHEGCDNCYAETLSHRWGRDIWGNDKPRLEVKSVWKDLERYQKLAQQAGEIHRVFVGSMMDIFEKPMPLIDSNGAVNVHDTTGTIRQKFFSKISEYPNLLFLLLTKRPSNINKYIPESWKDNPPDNVMFGTSPVNQETFDKLVGQLCQVNGRKFLSVEPQLDRITLNPSLSNKIDWIIQGGESGHGRRPFNLSWAYQLMDECGIIGIPYFFKQIDKVQPIPEDLLVREFPVVQKSAACQIQ